MRAALSDPDLLASSSTPAPTGGVKADPDVGSALPETVWDDPLVQRSFTRWRVQGDGQSQAESTLLLTGMHCAACAGLIEGALAQVDGVVSARVSAAAQRAEVCWLPGRTPLSQLVAAVDRAGYGALPDNAAGARSLRQQESRQVLWRLFVAWFCAMQVMMMATPSYVAQAGELAPDLRQLLNWGSWVLSVPVLLFAAGPFFSGAWRSVRLRRIGMDVPVALGIAVTFIASTGATFDPAGPWGREVYFDSLTMFVSFLLTGRYFEMRVRHRAAQALEGSLSQLPAVAWRMTNGVAEPISLQRIAVGDVLRVPLGEAFAADGVLLQGQTQADEALLTGESRPVDKREGDAVVAGSVNIGAPVLMRAEKIGADTRHDAILTLMREALLMRPASAGLAERWAGPFLWCVLILAGGGAAVWSVIDPARAVWVAVSVLIVTCPCALSLAAPAALLAATGALARRGVLVQRLDAIEALARVDTVMLDKTGTLTDLRGAPLRARPWPSLPTSTAHADEHELAQRAAGLAAWSQHPVSRAVVRSLGSAAASDSAGAWQQVQELPAKGLQAVDAAGRTWRLGALAWASDVPLPPSHDMSDIAACLACDGQPLLLLEWAPALRPDAPAAVSALQGLGLQVQLLSGDTVSRVADLAQSLGLQNWQALCTPQAKLDGVAAAQAQGHAVAMVGDGVNDAPVLARADVSFAMGQGALAARVQSDLVVVSEQLSSVPAAVRLSRRTVAVIRQNLRWALVYNLTCVPLALLGYLPPWAAGLGMASSSLAVVLNAARLAVKDE